MTDDATLPGPGSGGPTVPPTGGTAPPADRSGPPPWLIPVLVAAIAALLIVVLIVVLGGDDDDGEPVDSTPADTTEPTDSAPVDTEAPGDTEPPATEAPGDTEPPATDPPATDPPATDPPATEPPGPDGPLAADVSTLGTGQASIASAAATLTLDTAVSCVTQPTVGLQVVSSVTTDGDATVYVIDITSDEGGDPFITVTDLGGQIGGFFFGQDGFPGFAQWTGGPVLPFEPTNQLTLAPVDPVAAAAGPINVSLVPADTGDCSTGFLSENWTFTDDLTPEVLDPFDPAVNGRQFAVLAECAGGLILSEGGTLLGGDLGDGQVSASIEFPTGGSGVDFWSSPASPGPNDSFVDQQGGGGDVTIVTRVEDFETGQSGNLTWTQRPVTDGGLVSIPCSA